MQLTHYIGIVAGILTAASQLPQLIKIIRERKAENISYFMLLMLLLGLSMWIWYGVLRNDIPLIVTNSFSFVVNLMMIFFTIHFKK
jgi:MtN3 and saliva related transmembrane protein